MKKLKTFGEWLASNGLSEDFTDDYAANSLDSYESLLARVRAVAPRLADRAEALRQQNPAKLDLIMHKLAQKMAEIEHGVPDAGLPPMKTRGDLDAMPDDAKSPTDMPPGPGGEGATGTPTAMPYKRLVGGPPTPDGSATLEPDAHRPNMFKLRRPNVG
jgi:hypothetical protein